MRRLAQLDNGIVTGILWSTAMPEGHGPRSFVDVTDRPTAKEGDRWIDLEASERFENERLLKAVAIWCAQRFGVPPAQARAQILAIYKAL